MNANQDAIFSCLAQAIEWTSSAIWQNAMRKHFCNFSKEDILKTIALAKERTQTAIEKMEELEKDIHNQQ
jgi:hypothetical protein